MSESPYSPETAGKLRLLYRLLISHTDFKHAARVGTHILENDLHARSGNVESPAILEALNCAMIIAYCRPFSGNDPGPDQISDLPGRFLRILSEREKEVHTLAMNDRNSVLAHSDASAWRLRPMVLVVGEHKILAPWSDDTRAPLTREVTEILVGMATKLRDAVFEERLRLEKELIGLFEAVDISDPEALGRRLFGSERADNPE